MDFSGVAKRHKKRLLQVRLELTASASHTDYKYGTLADCATGVLFQHEHYTSILH